MTSNPNLRICLKKKRILINREAIKMLGNPTHLSFRYDDSKGVLFITPADSDDLDAFEIPHHFWNDTYHQCEISRIAFLRALQYRVGWKDGSKHFFSGTITVLNEILTLVYVLTEGTKIR